MITSQHESFPAGFQPKRAVTGGGEFGFLDKDVVSTLRLQTTNWRQRIDAIEHIADCVTSLREDSEIQIADFLKFLVDLLDDVNFKVCTITFCILSELTQKIGKRISPFFKELLLPRLLQKWGENKSIIRQNSSTVLTKAVNNVIPANELVSMLLSQFAGQHWRIKEEALNFIIYCLLVHQDNYDFKKIVEHFLTAVRDVRLKVKFLAIEAMAVVHSILGHSKTLAMIAPLELSNAENYQLLVERFEQNYLPEVCHTTSGIVQHKLLLRLRQAPKIIVQNPSPAPDDFEQVSSFPRRARTAKSDNLAKIPWDIPLPTSAPRAHSAPRRISSHNNNNNSASESAPEDHQSTDQLSDDEYEIASPVSLSSSPNSGIFKSKYQLLSPSHESESQNTWLSESKKPKPTILLHRFNELEDASSSSSSQPPSRASPLSPPSLSTPPSLSIQSSPTNNSRIVPLTDMKPTDPISPEEISQRLFAVKSRIRSRSNSELPKSTVEEPPLVRPIASALATTRKRYTELSITTEEQQDATNFRSLQPTPNHADERTPPLSLEAQSGNPDSPAKLNKSGRRLRSAEKNVIELAARPIEDVPSDQLTPCSSPERDFNAAITDIASNDWMLQFHAITCIRRLVQFHKDIVLPNLHSIIVNILHFVNNLRSALSKNALMCLTDMFVFLGKAVDTELESIVPVLLKKSGDSTKFINNEAEKALHSMIANTTEEKVLASMMGYHDHKSAAVRSVASMLMAECISKMGSKLLKHKDISKILHILMQFLNDGNQDARRHGRKMAAHVEKIHNSVHDSKTFDRFLTKYYSMQQHKEFKDALEKEKHDSLAQARALKKPPVPKSRQPSEVSSLPSTPPITIEAAPSLPPPQQQQVARSSASSSASASSSSSSLASTPSSVASSIASTPEPGSKPRSSEVQFRPKPVHVRQKSTPVVQEELPAIYQQLDAGDWKDKMQGITQCTQLFCEKGEQIGSNDLIVLFDHFLPRLSDSNTKVNIHAFTNLNKIIPQVRDALDPVLNRLLPVVANTIGGSNPQIKSAAVSAFDLLVSNVNPCLMVPYLPATFHTVNVKVKPAIIEKITVISERAHSLKPQLVTKHIVPLAFKLAKDTKATYRAQTSGLMKSLSTLYGSTEFTQMSVTTNSAEDHQKVLQLLN